MRLPGPATEAYAHARREFQELADIAAGKRRGENAPSIPPLALEAVKTTEALFDIECGIDTETAGLSRNFPVASTMGYKRQRGVAQ